jgi:predicted outer membrane repeat protein
LSLIVIGCHWLSLVVIGCFEFEFLNLFGFWCLEFGIFKYTAMKKLTLIFFVFHFSFFTYHISEAQVIHVPGDYPTIQQGIDAANPGDTVLVSNGLYYENISLTGKKPLLVTSLYAMDNDTNHINNTIIDGSQFSDIDNASVVCFKSGEDTTSILCGFTIQGGRGTWDVIRNNRCGGGIYISGSGAKIIHNKVNSNTADDTQAGNGQETYGGGIGTSHEDAEYWIVIEHNQIYNNTVVSQYGWSAGGGIYDSYNARIAENVITENTSTTTTNGWASGGGFSHLDLEGAANTLIILNNQFHHNIAQSINGVGLEGATCAVNVHLIFSGNDVTDNEGISPSSNTGGMGGLLIINPAEGCIVSGNVFRENIGTIDGGALILENFSQSSNPNLVIISDNYFLNNHGTYGGAIRDNGIPVIFQNNVFHGNQANQRGGAIYADKWVNHPFDHLVTLINNSFSGNSAVNFGGAIYSIKTKPLIINTVFYGNEASEGQEIYLNHYLDTLDIAFCNIDQELIYGNVSDAGGNINEDPGFLDDTCHIDQYSPCEDHGADSLCIDGTWYYAPLTDFEGSLRPYHMAIDIGADECDIITLLPDLVPEFEKKIQVHLYPNPTQGIVDFRLSMVDFRWASMKIYDVRGREVALVLEGKWSGDQVVRWDAGGLPAGVYYYRLRAKGLGQVGAGKIVKY